MCRLNGKQCIDMITTDDWMLCIMSCNCSQITRSHKIEVSVIQCCLMSDHIIVLLLLLLYLCKSKLFAPPFERFQKLWRQLSAEVISFADWL